MAGSIIYEKVKAMPARKVNGRKVTFESDRDKMENELMKVDHPYGNKTDLKYIQKEKAKHVIPKTLKGAATLGTIAAFYGKASKSDPLNTAMLSAIGAVAGGSFAGRKASKNLPVPLKNLQNEWAPLSYLSSKEQKDLFKKKIDARNQYDIAYDKLESLYKLDDDDERYKKALNAFYVADNRFDATEREYKDAIKRGMEIMNKKASIDYEEMVKLAYEDIMADF